MLRTWKLLILKLIKTKLILSMRLNIQMKLQGHWFLFLILPKICGHVKTFKVKDGDNDKNKLMSFGIDDQKLLEKCKTLWTKIVDLKNNELNALRVFDNRYIKNKIRIYDDKGYSSFRGLNAPEDDMESESFTVISVDFLLLHKNKYYLQMHLDNCAGKTVDQEMLDYLEDNISKTDEKQVLSTLYNDRDNIIDGIDPTENSNIKKYMQFVTTGFLTMGSNFKILYPMVVIIKRCCVLI